MLWLPMRALDPFVRFPQVFGSSECCLAASLGEFCVLGSFGLALTILVVFVAIFASFVMLWPSVRVPDVSAWFLKPFGMSGAHLAPSGGEFGGFQPFRRILTFFNVFSAIPALLPMLCMSVCPINLSARFPQLFSLSRSEERRVGKEC